MGAVAHGTDRSRGMLRRGNWKLCFTQEGDEVELYNFKEDPAENVNLATDPKYNNLKKDLINSILLIWKDPDTLNKRIKFSHESRTIIRKLSKNNPVFNNYRRKNDYRYSLFGNASAQF